MINRRTTDRIDQPLDRRDGKTSATCGHWGNTRPGALWIERLQGRVHSHYAQLSGSRKHGRLGVRSYRAREQAVKQSRSDQRPQDSGSYPLEGIHPHWSTLPTGFRGAQSSILVPGKFILSFIL
jgi:hypothetical protein